MFSFCEVMKSVGEKLWRSEVGGWWLRAIYHFENFALIEIKQVPIKRGIMVIRVPIPKTALRWKEAKKCEQSKDVKYLRYIT